MPDRFQPTQFKVWYSHQVPCESFEREVPDAATGELLLDVIYSLALFQFDHKMIPDYCNTSGVVYLDEDGEWSDYDTEEWAV